MRLNGDKSAIESKSPIYTLEEYLELEENSEEKFEFFDGVIWNASRESINHCLIIGNTLAELNNSCRNRGIHVFASNLKLKVPGSPPYRYADGTAVAGKPMVENFHRFELLTNPTLIVEVLSPSTEAFDVNEKFTHYKSIESFTEYLLISQDYPHVVLYTKQDEEVWLHREYNDLQAKVYLSSLDCELSVAEIYLDIEFENINRPRFPVDRPDFR